MKFSVSTFLFVFFLFSCSKSEKQMDLGNLDLVGIWVDQSAHATRIVKNGVTTDTTYPNITYHLRPDGYYDVDNFGSTTIDPFERGQWVYDSATQILTMTEINIDSTSFWFNFTKIASYTWKIEESDETQISVLSSHTKEYMNFVPPVAPITIENRRVFVKE
jgi:hypothetical protein